MAVETDTRRILGFEVSSMPAKGLLAAKARKKYGPRPDHRAFYGNKLFTDVTPYVAKGATIRSDSNPHYPSDVKRHFPKSLHITSIGRRGCVTGQGELKAGGFDPLFALNHTFAMYRANINRLFRRTWNTTKKAKYLKLHIAIYSLYHNELLIK